MVGESREMAGERSRGKREEVAESSRRKPLPAPPTDKENEADARAGRDCNKCKVLETERS